MSHHSSINQSDKALLLIEFQQEWLSQRGKLHHLFKDTIQFQNSIKCAEEALNTARNSSMHVIHSGLKFSEGHKELGKATQGLRLAIASHQTFLKNSEGSQFGASFTPHNNEFVVQGRIGSSAFSGSNLDSYLRNNNIRTLFVMGYALHVCVESTMRAAHDLGYEVVIIEDSTAAFTAEQKHYVLNEIVHHFGSSISTRDFINNILNEKNYETIN